VGSRAEPVAPATVEPANRDRPDEQPHASPSSQAAEPPLDAPRLQAGGGAREQRPAPFIARPRAGGPLGDTSLPPLGAIKPPVFRAAPPSLIQRLP
jgi:hypothetical protein